MAAPYGCDLRDVVIGEYVAQATSSAARGRLVSPGVPLSGKCRAYVGPCGHRCGAVLAGLGQTRLKPLPPWWRPWPGMTGTGSAGGAVGWLQWHRRAAPHLSRAELGGLHGVRVCRKQHDNTLFFGGGRARQGPSLDQRRHAQLQIAGNARGCCREGFQEGIRRGLHEGVRPVPDPAPGAITPGHGGGGGSTAWADLRG